MGIDDGCPIHGDIGVDFCSEHDVCELCMSQRIEPDCCDLARSTEDGERQ